MPQRIATLLHVSDLHFGDLDPIGDSQVAARAPLWWRRFPHFEGFLGHHRFALEHLDDFAAGIASEDPLVVVTGDLTTAGSAQQLARAATFLTGAIAVDGHTHVGLRKVNGLDITIPGNHDHWPGTIKIVGGPAVALGATLGPTPRVVRHPLPGTALELVFVLIDTDAEVNAFGLRRLLARGHCPAQLQAASNLLGPPRNNEIRVAVLHHSKAYSERIPQPRTLSLSGGSIRALNQFTQRHGIRVLLTGHVHVPDLATFPGGVYEARCGTTTQREDLPLTWVAQGVRATLPPNTLLLHRLYDAGGAVEWHVHRFQRRRQGFDEYACKVFAL